MSNKAGRSNRGTIAKRKQTSNKSNSASKKVKYSNRNENTTGRLPHLGSYATAELARKYGLTIPTIDTGRGLTKKKIAIFFGYLGTDYAGFQMNEGVATVQSDVELALYKAGLLMESNFGHPNKYSWSVSGRTDKGVHAAAQVVSLKVELPPADNSRVALVNRVNEHLPQSIRVLDMVWTTKCFCAKTHRDKVKYSYLVPSYVFFERSQLRELFAKIVNYPGNGCPIEKPICMGEITRLIPAFKDFRIPEGQHSFLKEVLQDFVGTHSFHNFTKRVSAKEARATRYIASIEVGDPVVYEQGLEWVPISVTGQSFLLNQIRKMVSVAIDITRLQAPRNMIQLAYNVENETLRFGLAPAQGLFLDMSYYESYNNNKLTGNMPRLEWGAEDAGYSEFRETVKNHIMNEETSQWNFIQYLFAQEFIFDHRRFYNGSSVTAEVSTP